MSKKYPPQQLHTPVLLQAVLELLNPQAGESYLDLTGGFGGHAAAVIAKTGLASAAILVDQDETALSHLAKLETLKGARLTRQDFASAAESMAQSGQAFDMVLLDLGVSSPQFDNPERGFSFQQDAALDMRMDQRKEKSAKTLVNKLGSKELSRIIQEFGEERPRAAGRIAQAIVAHRPIESTAELARIITEQHRGGWQKTHPATRTFQALRIAVNDELGQLCRTLPLLPKLLNPGGRAAVISFHSLEDRQVKAYFNEQSRSGLEATLRLLNKKPISGADQDVHNPRARSAKLRAAVKINTQKERTWT